MTAFVGFAENAQVFGTRRSKQKADAFRKLPFDTANLQMQSFPRSARSEAKRRNVKRGERRESKYGRSARSEVKWRSARRGGSRAYFAYHNPIADLNAVNLGLDSRLRGNDGVCGIYLVKDDFLNALILSFITKTAVFSHSREGGNPNSARRLTNPLPSY
ncbi:MAG: hypothetical protein LBQ52_09755 [Helicobacteraceae bacterium]|jgi:hypothetical protein|nr:hypothetical protein [Helicobacteraceae bacterium]